MTTTFITSARQYERRLKAAISRGGFSRREAVRLYRILRALRQDPLDKAIVLGRSPEFARINLFLAEYGLYIDSVCRRAG